MGPRTTLHCTPFCRFLFFSFWSPLHFPSSITPLGPFLHVAHLSVREASGMQSFEARDAMVEVE